MSNSQSWSPWHLEDLNANNSDSAFNYALQLHELELLREELLKERETFKTQCDKLIASELKKAYDEGYREGFTKGESDGLAQGQKNAEEAAQQAHQEFIAQTNELMNQFSDLINNTGNLLPEKMLIISLAASKALLGTKIKELQQELSAKIMDEIEKLPLAPKQLTLRINPNDWDFIQGSISKLFIQNNWKMIKDDELVKGGFAIETDTQEIDATLESKWQEIINLSEGIFINDQ